MAPIPNGINNVGLFTLIGSVGLLWFTAFVVETSINGTLFEKLLYAAWASFAFVGIALSLPILIAYSSKRLWYVLMGYWFSFLIFWLWFDLRDVSGTWRGITGGPGIIYLGPIAYSAICIAYFLTKAPRHYFHFEISGIQAT